MKRINPYKRFVGSYVPNWLLCRKEVSQGSKVCYARLALYAGEKGYCYPFQETLAQEIGVSDRHVRRYLKELTKFKLIEYVQQGLNSSNIYYFLWHEWMEIDEEVIEFKGPDKDVRSGADEDVRSGADEDVRSERTNPSGPIKVEKNHPKRINEKGKSGRNRAPSKSNSNNHDEPPPTPEQQDEALASVKPLLDKMLGRSMPPAEEEVAAVQARKAEQLARAKAAGIVV